VGGAWLFIGDMYAYGDKRLTTCNRIVGKRSKRGFEPIVISELALGESRWFYSASRARH